MSIKFRKSLAPLLAVVSMTVLAALPAVATNREREAAPASVGRAESSDATPTESSQVKELVNYLGLNSQQVLAWQISDAELASNLQATEMLSNALRKKLDASLESGDACASGALLLKIRETNARVATAYEDAKARFVALLDEEQRSKLNALATPAEQAQPGEGSQ